jgi:hypothetical protein
MRRLTLAVCLALLLTYTSRAASSSALDLNTAAQSLDLRNGRVEVTTYRGKSAIHLTPAAGVEHDTLAILKNGDFHDGVIEAEIAGSPLPGTDEGARGFIGIAFRVQGRGEKYECFYLRPTNGRTDDQLRRNHALQYVSEPEYPWHRLRKEAPGVYESYADIQPAVWTKIKIVVEGTKARLYINGGEQPSLIVNDLKLGDSHGAVALWAAFTTDAYFAEVSAK